ncbi:MAG TPA: alpha-amylase family glycosyl hydrolase [Bacteroidota bacterium]|nr:alpha-amylase family glycosyl hydrolase [Bacteroidota bacterium]
MKDPAKLILDGQWLFKVDSLDKGTGEEWYRGGIDRSDWQSVEITDYWDRYNLSGYDGVGWFARSFEFNDTTNEMAIFFSGVDDDADVWINGIKVGTHEGYGEAFYFDVARTLRSGNNEVVVKVNDRGGPGGIYMPVNVVRKDRIPDLLKTKYADLNARPSADWVRDAVIYEVYLRSFSKEGTFKALEKRIPELKSVGVTVVWLMPIHPIGELNRKGTLGSPYSIENFYGINLDFGTLDDFKSLVKTVHEQGLRIIIDLVANHTSWDSKLVQEHPEWFTKNEEGNIVAPNADWTDVADLNYGSHELRKYMIEMMKYWVRDIGIDGYRCDVSELVPTDFWDVARNELEKIKPVMMLSEGTFPEHHVKAFDLTYSWNFYDALDKVIKGSTPCAVFDELLRNEAYKFPKGSLRMRFNTNHDKNAWEAPAVKKYSVEGAKATAVLMFTYPGVPLIYNGEEVGNMKSLDLFEKVEIDWNKNPGFRELYRGLSDLRAKHPALRRGRFKVLPNSDSLKVFSFERQLGEDYVMVAVNLSKSPRSVHIDLDTKPVGSIRDYFTAGAVDMKDGGLSLQLKPFGYKVFIKE